MENLSDRDSVRRVLATEVRLREVREAMHALFPVESGADLAALTLWLSQEPVDEKAAQLIALGNELAALDYRVLEESARALEEMGFDSAAVAVTHGLGEARREDFAASE